MSSATIQQSSSEATAAIEIAEHGWTAVPRDVAVLLKGKESLHEPGPLSVEELSFPEEDDVVRKVRDWVKGELRKETFNHSMRVYFYGRAIIQQQFPDWTINPTALALTALLHDIGTTAKNTHSTRLSFEYQGGMLAHAFLSSLGVPVSLAEAVTEAIFRHQDLDSTTGNITALGQIIQLATIFDNVGGHDALVHRGTVESVVKAWPRTGWSGCFAEAVREEVRVKPWAHTTALGVEVFPRKVLENRVFREWD